MAESVIMYEVRPVSDGWEIRMASDSQKELVSSRELAVARARQLVDRYHGTGRVIVRRADGEIESEYVHEAPMAPGSR